MLNGRSPPILFDANGEAFDTGSVTEDTTYDVVFEIKVNVSREDHALDGWYTATSGIKVISGAKWVISSETVTPYVYRTANKYGTIFDVNDSVLAGDTFVVAMYDAAFIFNQVADRTRYTFTG